MTLRLPLAEFPFRLRGARRAVAGVLAGLLAQGLAAERAAAVAGLVHGAAADTAAQESGERGLLASDLLPHLRRLVNPS